jgi:Rrf2 family nitric oxide-sensitive transcriptional repressor
MRKFRSNPIFIAQMRLTTYTDYALRTLMYLSANRDRLVTIQDIADLHGIAKNHLTKVVHQLGILGVVETVRGRNGGLKLARDPAQINIGDVVRNTEPDFNMAECFDRNKNACILSPSCVLKGVLGSATAAYLAVLDGVTLEQLVRKGSSRTAGAAGVKPVRIQPPARIRKA